MHTSFPASRRARWARRVAILERAWWACQAPGCDQRAVAVFPLLIRRGRCRPGDAIALCPRHLAEVQAADLPRPTADWTQDDRDHPADEFIGPLDGPNRLHYARTAPRRVSSPATGLPAPRTGNLPSEAPEAATGRLERPGRRPPDKPDRLASAKTAIRAAYSPGEPSTDPGTGNHPSDAQNAACGQPEPLRVVVNDLALAGWEAHR